MDNVININEPCIQDLIIQKDEQDLCITTKDGQIEYKLFLGDKESVMLTLNFGDVSNIGWGGTDNWGKDKLPLYLKSDKGAENYDSVFVNNITIQEYAGEGNWCKCELINQGKNVRYVALNENRFDKERIAYFWHTTTDSVVNNGFNKGKPVAKKWCVTVIQNPGKAQEQPKEEIKEKINLGKYLYSVALITDLHMCEANNYESTNWWDEDDFKRAMNICVNDKNIKFIASCGDISESQTNDNIKHPESTAEVDYKELTEMYDVPYWQVAGLRLFSPLGNHDFYGIFESRYGDTITGKKNTETIIGYNAGVNSRLGNWVTGQQINGIVPGRGRIVFDLEKGKSTANGQADMRFFSYNDYVDLYTKKGGYTGSSIWDANKGGISDEAIKCAKKYVNNNWNAVKDNLVMWDDGGGHGRNGYSKLNYWMRKDNDIYIFLSVDYGNDIWGVTKGWHDRMIHARQIINLNEDDPYIKRMKEYVSDTEYSSVDEPYNYQYYSPNTLIWLKEILENNKNKKIYIFTHHFMPNRVGNGVGLAKDGNWFYSVISPAKGDYNEGSNTLTGVEYWFINKLMNQYDNVIWFSGHSHISFTSNANFDNHEYPIVSPSEKNKYVYTKSSNTPVRESAWCVALPSLSKPRGIENGQSIRHYEDAEMGVMEVYEKGVKIKGYKIREDNKDVNKLVAEKEIQLL